MAKELKVLSLDSPTAVSPHNFISMALTNNLSLEHLEKLLTLQERWEANQARKAFFIALSEFQSQCPSLEKTKRVYFVNRAGTKTDYKYAPLGEIAEAIKAPMATCGLSHRWELNDSSDNIQCTCIISHVAGHNERCSMSAKKDDSGGKNEIQSRASTITYLQRYTLIASLGISTADEDNDGQNGDDGTKEKQKPSEKVNKITISKPPAEDKSRAADIANCKNLKDLRKVWSLVPKEEHEKVAELFGKKKKELRAILDNPIEELTVWEICDQILCLETQEELNTYIKLHNDFLSTNCSGNSDIKQALDYVKGYAQKKAGGKQ